MTTYLCYDGRTQTEIVLETVNKKVVGLEPDEWTGFLFAKVVNNHPMRGAFFCKPNSKKVKKWEACGSVYFIEERERPRPPQTKTLFHSRLEEAYEKMMKANAA